MPEQDEVDTSQFVVFLSSCQNRIKRTTTAEFLMLQREGHQHSVLGVCVFDETPKRRKLIHGHKTILPCPSCHRYHFTGRTVLSYKSTNAPPAIEITSLGEQSSHTNRRMNLLPSTSLHWENNPLIQINQCIFCHQTHFSGSYRLSSLFTTAVSVKHGHSTGPEGATQPRRTALRHRRGPGADKPTSSTPPS